MRGLQQKKLFLLVIIGIVATVLLIYLWAEHDHVTVVFDITSPNRQGNTSEKPKTQIEPGIPANLHGTTCEQVFDPYTQLTATRWAQYHRFKMTNPRYKFNGHGVVARGRKGSYLKRKYYSYNTTLYQSPGFVSVFVTEYYNRAPTQGGSSFFGNVTSADALSVCSYTDFFNGSYMVLCPLYSACVHAEVTVHQTNYTQYTRVMEDLKIVLVNTTFCGKDNVSCSLPHKPNIHWTRPSTAAPWRLNVHEADDTIAFCRHIESLGRIYMVGASHTRFQQLHLSILCQQHIEHFSKRLFYVDARYGHNVVTALREFADPDRYMNCYINASYRSNLLVPPSKWFMSHRPAVDMQMFVIKGPNDTLGPFKNDRKLINWTEEFTICRPSAELQTTVIVQTGSWDLTYLGMDYFITSVMPRLDEALGKLAMFHQRFKSLNILVLGPPPINYVQYKKGRTMEELQLYGDALRQMATKHGFSFFSIFEAIYARYKENIDMHYMISNGVVSRGQVGQEVFKAAVMSLVDHIKTGD